MKANNAIDIIMEVLPETEKQSEDFFNMLCSEIECGEVDSLKLLNIAKKLKYFYETLYQVSKEYALIELEPYSKEDLQSMNIEISQSGRYDYKECSTWSFLNSLLKEHETKMKNAYKRALQGKEYEGTPAAFNANSKSIKFLKQ